MMKPNILIINPDQMRADAMRHLGNQAAFTPNMDALAEEGVSFSSAFCQNPVCVPSRCSFMTGLYPHIHGHRTMGYLLHPGEENLFSDLKSAGYYTISSTRGDLIAGQYSKWNKALVDHYLTFKRPAKKPSKFQADRGAEDSDTFYSFLDGIIPTQSPGEVAVNMDDLTIDAAVDAIGKRPKDKPFFMFVGLMYPHPPYQIEQKYYDLIDPKKLPDRMPTINDSDGKPTMERGLRDSLRISGWSEERLREIRRIYLAMVAKVDDQLGRIINALKEQGIYDNTIILFFSDHGDYTTDFGIVEKAQNCFPDCLTNVPLIIKPQKGIPVDCGVNSNLAELNDICATVCDLADVEIKRSHFSKSLVPVLKDKTLAHRDFVCCEGGRLIGETHCSEYNAEQFNAKDHYAPRQLLQAREDGTHTKAVMIRTSQYKYVYRLEEQDEFYDLALGERRNLIHELQYADEVERLKNVLLRWMVETCDVVPLREDDRFPPEFIQNMITGVTGSPLMGRLVAAFMKFTGKSVNDLRKMVGK